MISQSSAYYVALISVSRSRYKLETSSDIGRPRLERSLLGYISLLIPSCVKVGQSHSNGDSFNVFQMQQHAQALLDMRVPWLMLSLLGSADSDVVFDTLKLAEQMLATASHQNALNDWEWLTGG